MMMVMMIPGAGGQAGRHPGLAGQGRSEARQGRQAGQAQAAGGTEREGAEGQGS